MFTQVKEWIYPKVEETKRKKIKLVPFADMHTCGTTSLHPNIRKQKDGKYYKLSEIGGWNYIDNPHFYPSARQVEIFNHLDYCLDQTAEERIDKTLLLMSLGDALEGNHHNTSQLITRDVLEQQRTHEELMIYIKERLNFQRGDSLYYVYGTEVHVHNQERFIAEKLGAYQYPNGDYCANFLEMNLNGAKVWAYHEGVSAGDYPTRGEALSRTLKKIYYKCKMEGIKPPDLVLSAHTHDPVYSTYTQDYHTIHGVILPSWQDKTRYVYDKMPLSLNKIGLQTIEISENGEIMPIKKPMLISSPLGQAVTI